MKNELAVFVHKINYITLLEDARIELKNKIISSNIKATLALNKACELEENLIILDRYIMSEKASWFDLYLVTPCCRFKP